MGFTDSQLRAIEYKGSDVLVSAAAGSGKTTVLVERIIRRILDENNPVDIDKILVLTFTKAAAAQMREKIFNAIEEMKTGNPLDEHIAKQSMLIQNAQISTFHGFCQEIIRNHFYEVDADPGLRVMDEIEGKLMKMDALKKILENAYVDANEDFLRVVESYTSGKSDKALEEIILGIYSLSQAQPDPDMWLDICEKSYDVNEPEDIINAKWFRDYYVGLKATAQKALLLAKDMIKLCDMPQGPAKYKAAAEDDKNYAESLIGASDFAELVAVCKVHAKQGLARISAKDMVDDSLKAQFTNKRELFYKVTKDIEKAALRSFEDEVKLMKKARPLAKIIIKLVREFSAEFADAKLDAGVIDFNDMEHLAIKILKSNGGITADEYRDRFVEIYVDEYQDSNLTQEEIISLIKRGSQEECGNTFMVGDVKQSIYRFRMARPDLFLGKYDSFRHEPESGEGCRIDLSDNFRSREEVLDCANEIFAAIMNKSIGGIEYDDAASLHYGHLYDEVLVDGAYKAELILANESEELSTIEAEVYAIASQIKSIVGKMDIMDSKTGVLRKVRYSDIVILLRGMSGRDTKYRNILNSCGIPAYVTTGVGYFSAREVETLLELLAVIDNPLQDIPLAAVLRSFFGGFTDENLATIRSGSQKTYLYNSLKQFCESDTGELGSKISGFIEMLNHYREESEYMSVYEILREIIDGEYGDYVRSRHNGSQADANLNMLLKKADDFGKLSYKGLFHFLRYIEQMRKYEIDYGEAGITDENDANVRIMTIHKSKGLEFPVVFVSALSKKRNDMDEKAEVISDADFGIGLNQVDIDMRIKRSTLLRNFMVDRLKKENIAEEIRVLYVALTRAKEKLFLVGTVKDSQKEFYQKDNPIEKCSSYLELIAHAYNQRGRLDYLEIRELFPEDYLLEEAKQNAAYEIGYESLNKALNAKKKDEWSKWLDVLKFKYPYADEFPEHAKVSVSELKKKSMQEDIEAGEYEPYVPDFVRELTDEENKAGSFYGTAFHRMMELWDYSISCGKEDEIDESVIDTYFEKMCNLRRIDRVQLQAVESSEILCFLRSNVGRKMGEAASKGQLYREQPFFISVEKGMLVQGIIDAYWIDDEGITILDYKTDRVRSGQKLVERYKTQLDYYGLALERLLDIPVKRKVIYASRLKEVVEL